MFFLLDTFQKKCWKDSLNLNSWLNKISHFPSIFPSPVPSLVLFTISKMYWFLLHANHYASCSSQIILISLHNTLEMSNATCIFGCKNWGRERLSNLSKVPELVSVSSGIFILIVVCHLHNILQQAAPNSIAPNNNHLLLMNFRVGWPLLVLPGSVMSQKSTVS